MVDAAGLTIKTKTILIAMVCTITALLTSVFFTDVYESHKSQQQMRQELTAIATILAERSTAALQFGDQHLAQQNLEALKSIDMIEQGCMYLGDKTLFAFFQKENNTSACPKISNHQATTISNRQMHIVRKVILDDTVIGSLYIEASLEKLEKLLVFYLAISLCFGGIAAVIAFLLATKLQKLVTNPINQLQLTAATIESTNDYTIRANKLSNDEIGDLVDAFNNMLERIESDNQMLRDSEQRFKSLTTSSPFGVFQIDPQGQFVYVNDCWRDITDIKEIHLDKISFANVMHPDERQDILAQWQEAFELLKPFKSEFRLLHQNSVEVNVICQAKPIFSADGKLNGYLGSLADVSELKIMQVQMEQLALYDPLTQLANQRLFRNRLEKTIRTAKRSSDMFAVIFLDFDHFKRINDSLGHDQGDELLLTMSKRLRLCTRPGDTISRFGGDEFTILIPEIKNRHEIDCIARKILKTLKKPIKLMGQEVASTCSIGITIYPEDAQDANMLLKNADLAMYKSKEDGRDRYHYFSEDMNVKINLQLKIENDLRKAIKSNEFELYFQPKINLQTEKLVGYEALLRWNHPENGLTPPDEFISVAEDAGLIKTIGKWVLQNVCEQISTFRKQGKLPKDCRIAVNLSPKQFHDPNLVKDIRSTLAKNNVDATFIELEITETLLMDNINNAIITLKELRAMGIALSIDDFGTGYSSFNYLKRLPIDIIKIDRSFVMDIPQDKDDMEIISAIIAMAHKLRLAVIAEGLETEAQKEFLRANQCDMVQGYLLGKPSPAHKLPINDTDFDEEQQYLN